MIPGIEVLSQNTVSDAAPSMVFAAIMVLCFLGFIGALYVMIGSYCDAHLGGFIIGTILLIIICGLCGFGIWKQTNPETHVEYKVLIDDTASWSDIYNKYEIIDQEGKIYTIKEKTK
jgi:hypothetical protein